MVRVRVCHVATTPSTPTHNIVSTCLGDEEKTQSVGRGGHIYIYIYIIYIYYNK